MPLNFVIGPPNSGRTGVVYQELRDAIQAGRRPVLVVPTRPDAQRARAEFAEEHSVGLETLPFDAYLEEVWLAHGDGRRLVRRARRDALIASSVSGTGGEPLAGLRGQSGGVELLARLAREAAGCVQGEQPTGAEAAALLQVIREYRRLLAERGLVEPAEAFVKLAQDPPRQDDPVVVHRFARLTPYQEAYLAALSTAGTPVFVTLAGTDAGSAISTLGGALRRAEASITVVDTRDGRTASRDLRLLAERLVKQDGLPVPTPEDVAFVLAGDADDEIEQAAEEAARAVCGGTPPERVAVVYRDPWLKERGLRRALAERGLLLDADIETPLRVLPLARSLTHLLRFQVSGRRADLSAWMRSPYSGVEPSVSDRLQADWRRRREQRASVLTVSLRRAAPAAAPALAQSKRLSGRPVDEAWAREFASLAQAALTTAHPGDPVLLRRPDTADAQAMRGLLRVLGEIADGAGGALTCSEVLSAVEAARVGPGSSERPGRIQLVSAERVRSRRFSTVILGGLTAEEFPGSRGDERFAAGAIREAAQALGVPPVRYGWAEERQLFVDVVTRARERLVLLTHSMCEDGSECAPSPFWEEALDVYRDGGDSRAMAPSFVRVTRREESPTAARAGRRLSERLAETNGRSTEVLANREVFSAGELELYLSCPARWFRERMLRPESPDGEFAALESGRLVHLVLRSTLQRLSEDGELRVTTRSLPAAMRFAEAAFREESARLPEAIGIMEADRRETAWAQVRAFLHREPTFMPQLRPVALETAFGFGEADVVDLGGFSLRGRVDRVDSDGANALVIDYKTGRIHPFRDFEKRGLLQLQLYAEVLRRRGFGVAGAVYRSLKTGAATGFFLAEEFDEADLPGCAALDADAFACALESALEGARRAVSGIRSGDFEPSPKAEACRFCPMAGGCERAAA